MSTTSNDGHAAGTRPRALARLRALLTNQVRLWERAGDDLQPWRQEGSLRWRGKRLDGEMLPESKTQPVR